MENRGVLNKLIRTLSIFTIFFNLSLSFQVSAYEVTTHKALHRNIINEYQRLTGKTLTRSEISAFLEGAEQEDKMINSRPVQHFYDPINKTGLTEGYPGTTYPSHIWATNPYLQGNFTTAGFKLIKDKKSKLFQYNNDYTFYRAVYEYAHEDGDKYRAMRALGQVMHLLEDMTSVPHTRDDPHPAYSPYENYTKDKTVNHKLNAIPKTSSIEELFHNTAYYTNTNFLSDDRKFDAYDLPKVNINDVQDEYLYNNVIGAKLAKIVAIKDAYGNIISIESPDIRDNTVLHDYWTHLSQKAVEAGVSLLDLFFREVEKERETNTLKQANLSYNEVSNIADKFLNSPKIQFKLVTSNNTYTKTIDNPLAAKQIKEDCKDPDYASHEILCPTLVIDKGFSDKLQGAVLANKFYKIFNQDKEEKLAQIANKYTNWTHFAMQLEKLNADARYASLPNYGLSLIKEDTIENKKLTLLDEQEEELSFIAKTDRTTAKAIVKSTQVTKRAAKKIADTSVQVVQASVELAEDLGQKSIETIRQLNQNLENLIQQNTSTSSKDKETKTSKANINAKTNNQIDDFNSQYAFLAYAARAPEVFSPGGFAFGASSSKKKNAKEDPKPVINILNNIDNTTNKQELSLDVQFQNTDYFEIHLNNNKVASSTSNQYKASLTLGKGQNTIKIIAKNQNTSTTKELTVTYDPTPSIQILATCDFSFQNNTCLTDSSATLEIQTDSDATLFIDNKDTSSSTAKLNISLNQGEEKTISITAKDKTSQKEVKLTIKSIIPNIIVNEYLSIKKDYLSSKPSHVYIELYNPNDYDLNLDKIYLEDSNGNKFYFQGKIKAKSFFAAISGILPDNLKDKISFYDAASELLELFKERQDRTLSLKFSDKTLDSFAYTNQAFGGTPFHSKERSKNSSFTSNICVKNKETVNLQDIAKVATYCASVNEENENSYYLSVSSTINNDLTLQENKTYIVPFLTTIQNAKLKIPEGVVLKFKKDAKLVFENSELEINASKSNPAVFSSLADKEYSANLSLDTETYWSGLEFIDSKAKIENLAVRHAKEQGYSGIYPFKISNTDFQANNLQISKREISAANYYDSQSPAFNIYNKSNVSLDSLKLDSGNKAFIVYDASLSLSNSNISSQKDTYFIQINDNASLIIDNTSFDYGSYIYISDKAKSVKIKNSTSSTTYVFIQSTGRNRQSSLETVELSDSTIKFYTDGLLRLKNTDFKIVSSPIVPDSDARLEFLDSNVVLKDSSWQSSWGGFIFENSNVEIEKFNFSIRGNAHAFVYRPDISACNSFILSTATITDSTYKDCDRAAIYAEKSDLKLKNINFIFNWKDVINVDSNVVVE